MTAYPIIPIAKPRMTRRDRWAKRPPVLRYRAFCDEVALRQVRLPTQGARVTFTLPMPSSWSRRKRARLDGAPHRCRPDVSNLLKALEDAVYGEDAEIWHYAEIQKVWGEHGGIIIEEEGA